MSKYFPLRMGLLLLPVAILSFPFDATGQKRKAIRRPVTAPIDFTARYISSINGIDCSNVAERYEAVSSMAPISKKIITTATANYLDTKSEFETTAAYDQRRAATTKAAFGGLTTIVVVEPISARAYYDADTGMLKSQPIRDAYYGTKEHAPKYVVDSYVEHEDRGNYVGSNAYGLTKTISKEIYRGVGYGIQSRGNIGKILLKLDPATAKAVKENAKFVMVADLKDEPVFQNYDRDKPTINSPSDTTTVDYIIPIAPKCAFIMFGKATLATIDVETAY